MCHVFPLTFWDQSPFSGYMGIPMGLSQLADTAAAPALEKGRPYFDVLHFVWQSLFGSPATVTTLVAEPVLWKLGPLPLRYIHFNFSIFEFHSQLLHSIFIYTSTCRPSSFGSIKVTKGSTITEFKAVDVYEATFGPHCEAWISSCDVPSCCKFHSLGRWDYQRFLYSTV